MSEGSVPLVCILAAGTGSRLGFAGGALHKALVPLAGRAAISRIIDRLPADARLVVAIGHLGAQVSDYLALAHPDRDITLVPVTPYEGPGSGPGRSLECCAPALDGPFVLTAVDTLVDRLPPLGDTSWMGVARVDDPERWLTLEADEAGRVRGLRERVPGSPLAFVGIAWIAEPAAFLAGLAAGDRGERQVTPGFAALLGAGAPVVAEELGWSDTGSPDTYARALSAHGEEALPHRDYEDITYVEPPRVVKWFRDPEAAARRVTRGRALAGTVPDLHDAPPGWLVHDFAVGDPIRGAGAQETARFLAWAEERLWRPCPRDAAFAAECRAFHGDKTRARLARYLARAGRTAEEDALTINGLPTRPVAEALEREMDAIVADAVPSTFHGDLHEGNVIRTADGYRLIDWRDAFGSSTTRGDRLYDLAKFLHTLELSEREMAGGTHAAERAGDRVRLTHPDPPARPGARTAFWDHCRARRYPERTLGMVDALVFVNMAPLYPEALGEHLYLLGRWLLQLSREAPDGAARERELTRGLARS